MYERVVQVEGRLFPKQDLCRFESYRARHLFYVYCMNRYRPEDWIAIQEFYDEGHPIPAVVREFGISNLTIQRARDKGLFKPRGRYELRQKKRKS